uniref:NADH-ubiquinone oxidoreductase chain 2 n=1 Tax=Contacyphon sp. BT0012 TaxID=546486 RepID=B6D8T1_9COLE|nr:NADH dehydrogenase subunit 2 [Contacyphon sp. BT0012]ACF35069.1 NADH dehydrogenase subunit 2 [Contacyphon sp. BT0012]
MNNIYKIIFFTTLISGTLISISSSSWMGTWMGLEINLISFVPLISNSKNLFSSESAMKYFLVQALASTSFLFSIILLMILNSLNEFSLMNWSLIMILNSSLYLKMGAAPLHFWFPEVTSKLNWSQSMILLTWQKIAPMMLLTYTMPNNIFSYLIIISSVCVGSIIGLNQTMMQKLMAYSSINHMGWMLASMLFMENIWMIYFTIYSSVTILLMMLMKNLNIFFMKQLFINMNNSSLKFSFIINFLSLGGLPPFLGFLPKWIIIQNMINENMFMLTFIMIMMTMITLFFYLRVTFSILLINYNENNWKPNLKFKNKKFIFILNMISISGLVMSTIIINMI